VPPQLVLDLGRETRARVDHREQDPRDAERRIEPPLHEVDRAEQLREPLEGVVLGLHRDEDAVGGREGVHGERAERRRAVEEDEAVPVGRTVGERLGEVALASLERRQLDARRGELRLRGHQIEVREGARPRQLAERDAVEQVEGRVPVGTATEARRRVRLRVEVDEQAPFARLGEARGEVDGGRRLADAALLIRNRDDPG
jgi:hypothetical protein